MPRIHPDAGAAPGLRSAPRRHGTAVLAGVTGLLLAAGASYTVQPGDTLSEIAARHGTSVSALAAANSLTEPDRIVAGRTLTLPGSGGGSGAAATGVASRVTHTVAPGETLSGIAVRYGVRASAIAQANGLPDPNFVRAGARLTIPGARAPAEGQPQPASRAQIEALIERIAREHGWSPAFVKAVAWQESGWNNAVVSHAGAIGVMQVLPTTGQEVSRSYGRALDLRVPEDNIRAGVLYLDALYTLTGRDVGMTLAGYFQGLGSVRREGLYDRTERYIDNVLSLRERFR